MKVDISIDRKMEMAHSGEGRIFSQLLTAGYYEAAYAQPCNALEDQTWNTRAIGRHDFEQSKAEHAISPVSHHFQRVERYMLETVISVQGISHEAKELPLRKRIDDKIGKRGNEKEMNRPGIANINRHQGQMGVR